MENLNLLWVMVTNDPLLGILSLVMTGLLVQIAISSIVLSKRKQILIDEYGYDEQQIVLFFWKSVLLFPLTWCLLVAQGWKWLWRKARRR